MGVGMGEQLFLERFVWFDSETRHGRYPNAFKLADRFEISTKTAQRSIDYFRDRLQAPLAYLLSRKGYVYTDSSYRLPVARISEAELLALLISRKLITEACTGSLADDLEHISRRLGSLLAANLPGRARPEDAFSFRWKGTSPSDPQVFKVVTSALLQGKLLSFSYYSPTASGCTTRTVEPHHMVNYLGNWHLIAYCQLREGWRDFMLGRMSQTRVGEGTFSFRPVEEWRPYLSDSFGIFQNHEAFEVVLRFTPERARRVKGELWQQGQLEEVEADGSLVLTIPVSREAEIMMEILKHGSQVEVVEPGWLREKVIEEMERAVVSYRSRG
jgi:predicted DNA-binding transcriptional regulator YafY